MKSTYLLTWILCFTTISTPFLMAQSNLIHINKPNKVLIVPTSSDAVVAAKILYSHLEQCMPQTFELVAENKKKAFKTQIILDLQKNNKELDDQSFIIKSDSTSIYIIANSNKTLQQGVYSLLEFWEFRKFTATVSYIPKPDELTFPKNFYKKYQPSFAYRTLLYPDAYDQAFREWHKLDWFKDDFGLWGHTFDQLVAPKKHFTANPKLYALYEGKRRAESLCMTNDTVIDILCSELKKVIAEKPNARYFSISQNDDVIYCECAQCSKLNKDHGGPQGSLYTFLNKIAKRFPKNQFCTLAYLHTYNPPTNLKIAPNITTLFCPIEMDRGNPISLKNNNKSVANALAKWKNASKNLFVWDYTVQFANYMSPFPNIAYFEENYTTFKENNVKGLFVQGYADVPGDFSELRQYLLAKLLWDTSIDVRATTADFLRGFYGKAAKEIENYLQLVTENQKKSKAYLDIYSGPVQNRTTYLTPEAMNQYDKILEKAWQTVEEDKIIQKRVEKLRLALEYTYFEQAKFYGADAHGLFTSDDSGKKTIKEGLNERVQHFSQECTNDGIYELSEGGPSPETYYKDWLLITQNTAKHLGEKMTITQITPPANDYSGKGEKGLLDGIKGHKDFNINWMGWYGKDPEIIIDTKKINYSTLKMGFLEDQRHWIFPPEKVIIYGQNNNKWELITSKKTIPLTENYDITTKNWEFYTTTFSKFDLIKIKIYNQKTIPEWRKRKNKKPMVMLDEIEFYAN